MKNSHYITWLDNVVGDLSLITDLLRAEVDPTVRYCRVLMMAVEDSLSRIHPHCFELRKDEYNCLSEGIPPVLFT